MCITIAKTEQKMKIQINNIITFQYAEVKTFDMYILDELEIKNAEMLLNLNSCYLSKFIQVLKFSLAIDKCQKNVFRKLWHIRIGNFQSSFAYIPNSLILMRV